MPTLNLNPTYSVCVRNGGTSKFSPDMWVGPADDAVNFLYRGAMTFSLATLPVGVTVTNVALSLQVMGVQATGNTWVIGPYAGDGSGAPTTDSAATIFTNSDTIADYYINNADWNSIGLKTYSNLGTTARTDVAARAGSSFSFAFRQTAESVGYTYSEVDGTTVLPVLTIDYSDSIATLTTPVTPTNASTVGSSFTASVTTDITSGTLRMVIDSAANLSGVTNTQVLAGQKASGTAAAYDSGNVTVSSTTPSFAFSGLATGSYTIAAAHQTSGGSSAVYTWTIVVDATTPSFSAGPALVGVTDSQYTVTGTSNETGTAKIIATAVNGSQPNNAAFDALVPGVSSDAVNITSGVQFQITH